MKLRRSAAGKAGKSKIQVVTGGEAGAPAERRRAAVGGSGVASVKDYYCFIMPYTGFAISDTDLAPQGGGRIYWLRHCRRPPFIGT